MMLYEMSLSGVELTSAALANHGLAAVTMVNNPVRHPYYPGPGMSSPKFGM